MAPVAKRSKQHTKEERKTSTDRLEKKCKTSERKRTLMKSKGKAKRKLVKAVKLAHAEDDNRLSVKTKQTRKAIAVRKARNNPSLHVANAAPVAKEQVNKSIWKPTGKEVPDISIQIRSGVAAVLQLNPNKSKLFSNEYQPIYLQITSMRVPLTPARLIRFELPHSLCSTSAEICLFVADLVKGKKHDHEPTVELVKQMLEEKGVNIISEVIPLRQVKTEYDQYELKRSLCNRYDFFLSEGKICGHVIHHLGKIFYSKKKVPVPVRLDAVDLNREIQKALSKTAMKVHSNGCVFVVQVAHTGQTQEEIENNISAAVGHIAGLFPGGWENIRSLLIKSPLSLAIPIYMTQKCPNSVPVPVVKPRRPKAAASVTGELSTLPGVKVEVRPSGQVIITGIDNSDEEWSDDELDAIRKKVLRKDTKSTARKSSSSIHINE